MFTRRRRHARTHADVAAESTTSAAERSNASPEEAPADALPADAPLADDSPEETSVGALPVGASPEKTDARISGPFDSAEYGDRGDLVDAGSLWLPLPKTALLQFGIDNATHQVLAAFYVVEKGAVQLQAYAAPRSHGIWDSVRRDLREALANAGGVSEEVDSPFGTALLSQVPTGENGVFNTQLFIGIEGPRWLLKATITSDAASDPALAGPLYAIIRDVVVHRGNEPYPPQEFLPLRLPVEQTPGQTSGQIPETDSAHGTQTP